MSLRGYIINNTPMNNIDYPLTRELAVEHGLNKYHGKACTRCANTLRRVKQYDCYTCHKEARKINLKAYKVTPVGAAYRKAQRLAYKERLVTQRPSWANLKAIREMYLEASRRGLEVDHVVPLKGTMVCGLHVEYNLQLLTPEENQAKRNSFVSDW